MKIYSYVVAAAVATTLLTSCSKNQWKVSGSIADAAGKTVVLESASNGVWSVVDSMTIADDNSFAFTEARPAYPDIYRLSIDGHTLYFPIDSLETITLDATLSAYDLDYKLSGSPSADKMQTINSYVAEVVKNGGEAAVAADDNLRRRVAEVMQTDWAGIVSYYAINRNVGSTPLFDAQRKFDRNIINAVANNYAQQRPTDPRTQMLKELTLQQRRASGDIKGQSVYAEEIPFVEIALNDRNGKKQSLTEVWKKGKCVILNFSVLTASESAAYNMALNDIYTKYAPQGVEIYQVCCDEDEFAWSAAAKNLPWITVYNTPDDATTLLNYNVGALPALFVIDRSGNRMERVEDIKQLGSVVAKML
jgi:hypothetical protein